MGIARKKIWLLPTIALFCLATGLLMYGVLSTQWIHVDCDNRGIEIGLWRMCMNALDNDDHAHGKLHQVQRNWSDPGEVCITILIGRGTSIPGWMAAIQLMTLLGIAANVFTTVLATMYLFIKSEEQIAIGIAAIAFCTGTFVFMGLFNTASHMYIHQDRDPREAPVYELIETVFHITCEDFTDSSSISLTLLWSATACIFLAGGLAVAASCFLESGLGIITQQSSVGYSQKEDVLYSLVEENEAFLDTTDDSEDSDEDYDSASTSKYERFDDRPSTSKVGRQESLTIKHETGSSKSTA